MTKHDGHLPLGCGATGSVVATQSHRTYLASRVAVPSIRVSCRATRFHPQHMERILPQPCTRLIVKWLTRGVGARHGRGMIYQWMSRREIAEAASRQDA